MKNKLIPGCCYLLIMILTLYSLGFEHGLYGIYTDLMLSHISVDEAFNSIVRISCIAVVILIVTAVLTVFLIGRHTLNRLLLVMLFIQSYFYGMIIFDHYQLKQEPNDGFTYPVIFEKFGWLTDIFIIFPFATALISMGVILFFIKTLKNQS